MQTTLSCVFDSSTLTMVRTGQVTHKPRIGEYRKVDFIWSVLHSEKLVGSISFNITEKEYIFVWESNHII